MERAGVATVQLLLEQFWALAKKVAKATVRPEQAALFGPAPCRRSRLAGLRFSATPATLHLHPTVEPGEADA
eukprot:3705252-Lingulodinium_polyedra.AAC.1